MLICSLDFSKIILQIIYIYNNISFQLPLHLVELLRGIMGLSDRIQEDRFSAVLPVDLTKVVSFYEVKPTPIVHSKGLVGDVGDLDCCLE